MRAPPDLARWLVAQYSPPPYVQALTPKQREIWACPARFKRAMAGRQSGKSHAALAWLLGGQRGDVSLAAARTEEQVKSIFLEPACELNERHGLDLHITTTPGSLGIESPNGARLELTGIRDSATAQRMRGRRFRRIYLDEVQSINDQLLRDVVFSVLQPTLLKKGGDLMLGGTPGILPRGTWYDICQGPNAWPVDFSGREFTYKDNPFLADPEKLIADLLASNGWTVDSPVFQREYLSQWVSDDDSRIYEWSGEYAQPPSEGTTVLGIDIGYDDGCGYSVLRMGQRPYVHVLYTEAVGESLPHEIYETTKALCERFSVNHIFADTAGGAKVTVEQLRQQFGLDVHAAKAGPQWNKRAAIDGVRGALKSGTLHLCAEAKPLADEWQILPWNDDRTDHRSGYADEGADATLYAMRGFLLTPGAKTPAPPDPVNLEVERRRREASRKASAKARRMRGR